MTMDALPNVYLQWAESAEAADTFLRYNVYRRPLGATAWARVGVIRDRSIAYYNDFAAGSAVSYEYSVTVTKDLLGHEVDGAHPTAVAGSVTFRSSFLHDVSDPRVYAELLVFQEVEAQQDIQFVQPWSRSAPTAHVGVMRAKTYRLQGDVYWDLESGVWAALAEMQARQATAGAVLMLRDYRGARAFVQISSLRRSDRDVTAGISLELREVHYEEAV